MTKPVAATLAVALAIVLSVSVPSALAQTPPVARTVDVVDHVFGQDVPDPYRWMEGNDNPEFRAWLEAQGAHARHRIDDLPSAPAWRQRLQAASAGSTINRAHQRAGDRLFFLRMGGKATGTLLVRDADGTERILLDPASLGKGASITEFAASPDGRLVAVNVDAGGSEVTRIRVLDATDGRLLPDEVGPVWGQMPAYWLPDGSGFSYTQMAPEAEWLNGDPLTHQRLRHHRLGTDGGADIELLRAGDNDDGLQLSAQAFPVIVYPDRSPHRLLFAAGAHPEVRVCVAAMAGAPAPAPWRCLVDYPDKVEQAHVHGNTLVLLSKRDRSNGRVLALDLAQPNATLADARELLAMDPEAIVTSLGVARDGLYVKRMRNGVDELLHIDLDDGTQAPVPMPGAGTAGLFVASPRHDGVLFSLQSWTTPREAHVGAVNTPSRNLASGATSPRDYSGLRSVETEATSADGTKVPVSIIHRSDVVPDGQNRAIVEGYGGYGVSLQPAFDPMRLEWVEAGGVRAICHVRGGGEKGDAWHRAGQGVNKRRGIEDLVACARELAARGYASPENIALFGGSMGGILVGGALAHHPDEFAVAAIAVGLLNPSRIAHTINGANQFAELGDPNTEAGMRALVAQDPYLALREGVRYPKALFAVGLNDSRVSNWETGKFAARLRALGGEEAIVWIRTDGETGHGLTSLDAAAATYADLYTALDVLLPGRGTP
ncbi:MAG: S9 family peptidase [Luteimonas sp.]|nr:S9 family peptidase [Luteimonas sp.]